MKRPPDDFVRRLHELLELVLYRSLSEDRWPAGRYWFHFPSPFLRLDVSFYGQADFQRLVTDGIGPKKPPGVWDLYERSLR